MEVDAFGSDFLRLALGIGQHVDGYIDAYFGPAHLADVVKGRGRRMAPELRDDLDKLKDKVPAGDSHRQAYLQATLRAMECTLDLLLGKTMDYLEEVQQLYDIKPTLRLEETIESAQATLDTLLPGAGPLASRLDARRKLYELETDQVLLLIEMAANECRRRTVARWELPPHEEITFDLVTNQPWSAYNWFQGNGRSRVEINCDLPVTALGLVDMIAHECYPGHHTELVLKEQRLVLDRGFGEAAVTLLHSPQAVISEAIATHAADLIFTDGSLYEWLVDEALPAANVATPESAAHMAEIASALSALRYVSGNAAILYHTGQLTDAQTIEYLCTYALQTEERAQKSFEFLTHPMYRSYVFTYSSGYDLLCNIGADEEKLVLFTRLLTELRLPSQLEAAAASTDNN